MLVVGLLAWTFQFDFRVCSKIFDNLTTNWKTHGRTRPDAKINNHCKWVIVVIFILTLINPSCTMLIVKSNGIFYFYFGCLNFPLPSGWFPFLKFFVLRSIRFEFLILLCPYKELSGVAKKIVESICYIELTLPHLLVLTGQIFG